MFIILNWIPSFTDKKQPSRRSCNSSQRNSTQQSANQCCGSTRRSLGDATLRWKHASHIPFNGQCHSHFVSDPKRKELSALCESHNPKQQGEKARDRILEAAKAGRRVDQPTAVSKLNFPLFDAPQTVRVPSKTAVLETASELTKHGVVFFCKSWDEYPP